ncbi:MAG: hypothetical protein BWX86_02272 [Verrucomicrobia bacterium ADurb.Bin122]|nr:MAG: hypothetical protein BWX86_02272 [Verrucomicrobia bacterium ADurb.Bin122]
MIAHDLGDAGIDVGDLRHAVAVLERRDRTADAALARGDVREDDLEPVGVLHGVARGERQPGEFEAAAQGIVEHVHLRAEEHRRLPGAGRAHSRRVVAGRTHGAERVALHLQVEVPVLRRHELKVAAHVAAEPAGERDVAINLPADERLLAEAGADLFADGGKEMAVGVAPVVGPLGHEVGADVAGLLRGGVAGDGPAQTQLERLQVARMKIGAADVGVGHVDDQVRPVKPGVVLRLAEAADTLGDEIAVGGVRHGGGGPVSLVERRGRRDPAEPVPPVAAVGVARDELVALLVPLGKLHPGGQVERVASLARRALRQALLKRVDPGDRAEHGIAPAGDNLVGLLPGFAPLVAGHHHVLVENLVGPPGAGHAPRLYPDGLAGRIVGAGATQRRIVGVARAAPGHTRHTPDGHENEADISQKHGIG